MRRSSALLREPDRIGLVCDALNQTLLSVRSHLRSSGVIHVIDSTLFIMARFTFGLMVVRKASCARLYSFVQSLARPTGSRPLVIRPLKAAGLPPKAMQRMLSARWRTVPEALA